MTDQDEGLMARMREAEAQLREVKGSISMIMESLERGRASQRSREAWERQTDVKLGQIQILTREHNDNAEEKFESIEKSMDGIRQIIFWAATSLAGAVLLGIVAIVIERAVKIFTG